MSEESGGQAAPAAGGGPEVRIDPYRLQQFMLQARGDQNLGLGIVGGLIGGVVGAALWAIITAVTSTRGTGSPSGA